VLDELEDLDELPERAVDQADRALRQARYLPSAYERGGSASALLLDFLSRWRKRVEEGGLPAALEPSRLGRQLERYLEAEAERETRRERNRGALAEEQTLESFDANDRLRVDVFPQSATPAAHRPLPPLRSTVETGIGGRGREVGRLRDREVLHASIYAAYQGLLAEAASDERSLRILIAGELHYGGGWSQPAVGSFLGVEAGTVTGYLSDLRRRMANYLRRVPGTTLEGNIVSTERSNTSTRPEQQVALEGPLVDEGHLNVSGEAVLAGASPLAASEEAGRLRREALNHVAACQECAQAVRARKDTLENQADHIGVVWRTTLHPDPAALAELGEQERALLSRAHLIGCIEACSSEVH